MVKIITIIMLSLLTLDCSANSQTIDPVSTPTPFVQTSDYQEKLKTLATERTKLANEYRHSANKSAVLEKARRTFVSAVSDEIVPFWFGTDWDFYGTTQTPKVGQIACGYFVTTVLRDAGVQVQRVSLAQQASENIIKSLTTAKFIKRFHNAKIADFVADIENQGEGLYIVGLDNHVGFILNYENSVWFIHSSYVEPSEVIKEKASDSPILSGSKYRVTGKISADNQFILKWLNQTAIPTVRR